MGRAFSRPLQGTRILQGASDAACNNDLVLDNLLEMQDLPAATAEKRETTAVSQQNSDSTPNWNKSYEPGLDDQGDWSFIVAATDAQVAAFEDLRRVHTYFRIAFADGAVRPLSGWILSVKGGVNNGNVRYTVTVCIDAIGDYIPASAAVRLQSVTTLASKTLKLSFSGAVTAAQFAAGSAILTYGGTSSAATTIAQGTNSDATSSLSCTNTAWPAAPAGGTFNLLTVPSGVTLPGTFVVQ